jgi:CRISPR/Cas system-associated exonuclease Cas4 (RecB family)
MTKKTLSKVYNSILGTEINEGLVMRNIPTTVFVLSTRCSAVHSSYLGRFKLEARKAMEIKDIVLGVLRQAVDNHVSEHEIDPFLDDLLLERISDVYQKARVKTLIHEIVMKVKEGARLSIGPRASMRKKFREYISAAYDLLLTKDRDALVYRLSRAREAEPDQVQVLLYCLLILVTRDVDAVTYVHYPVSDQGKGYTYYFSRADMHEDAEDTVMRILTKLNTDKIEQGKHCERCAHSAYCPVLKELTKLEADNVENITADGGPSESSGAALSGILSGPETD